MNSVFPSKLLIAGYTVYFILKVEEKERSLFTQSKKDSLDGKHARCYIVKMFLIVNLDLVYRWIAKILYIEEIAKKEKDGKKLTKTRGDVTNAQTGDQNFKCQNKYNICSIKVRK